MLDTSGILSNHLQKLANGNLPLKLRDNEYTEVERLLSSISKKKLKQALEEVNFDVYEVLLRDLSSNVIIIVKHASSVLSSFLEITRDGIKDKKSLLGLLTKIVTKNKSLDDIQLSCDALKCTRFLIDTGVTEVGHDNSLESFILEQLDVSSNKPEPLVIESLLLFKAMLECNLLDLRDKTSSWLKPLLDRIFDKNPDVRAAAIAAFNVFKPCLTGSEKYLDDLENNLIKSKYSKLLIELLPSDKNWAVIWRMLLELMGKRFHHNSSLVNSLLAVEEKAFKSFHVDTKKEAFINWKSVILSFASDRSVISSERRVKLLAIPLRANNCRSLEIALAKFDVWWFLLVKLQSDASRYLDLVLTPFLKFCFGPFSDLSLPSANGQNMLNNVNNGETLGRLYPAIRVPCMQALTQILCFSAGSALPPHLAEDLVIMSPTEAILKSGQDFCSVSRILTQCVGEAMVMTTSDADFAWIIESWRSLLILINRGSGETSCFDESNSKDVKNVSLVKDVLRLLINLVESVFVMPDSKMYGKVILMMIEALCMGETTLHPSVLNSHVYSVGNSQLMTGSPTLLLASLLLSPILINSETDQARFMMVFSNLLSLGLNGLSPPLPFVRTLMKKMETLAVSEGTECFPLAKLIWVSVVNQLSDSIDKDATVSEGNDAHHDFQCIYGILMFPIAHFLKTDSEKETLDVLLKPWEKLFKLFFINSQFLITTQPSEVIEELCRKILVYVKKADTSLNYISHLVEYVLIIYSINFYEEYWKSTIGFISKGERSTLHSSRQLLYVLFYKICDLISSLEGSTGSEKHASVMSYLTLVLSIGLNHDLMGFLFEKAAACVHYYLKLTAEKCPKAVEKEMTQLWEKFLEYVGKKVISSKRMSQYHIDVMVPLLEAGFRHPNIKMVELTKSLWNKTLGEQFSDVTIPPSLADILENVLRDETESEGAELITIKEKVSPFKRPVLSKNLLEEKKTTPSIASTLIQGNSPEFVAISPRQKSPVLTEHQKEKMKSRRVDIPALYQDMTQDSASQGCSQEVIPSVMGSSTMDSSDDANPPFPKASLKKDELTAICKDSPSSMSSRGPCGSGLLEDKKVGDKGMVFTESVGLEESSIRKQLLKEQPVRDKCNLEKASSVKVKDAESIMNESSLKQNKVLESRSVQLEVKSADSAAALVPSTDEENVVNTAKKVKATKSKHLELSESSSKEKTQLLTCNQSEHLSADFSSAIKPDNKVPLSKGSESKKTALPPGTVADETSKNVGNKTEVNNLSKEVSISTSGASIDKAAEEMHSTQDSVKNTASNVLGGLLKDQEEMIVTEPSKPSGETSCVEISPVLVAPSKKSVRKSSRSVVPLPGTPSPSFSDPAIVSESSNDTAKLRRKRGRPRKLGTPSPISHISKISLNQKMLAEEIESAKKESSTEMGGKVGKELVASEKTVAEIVEEVEVNSGMKEIDGLQKMEEVKMEEVKMEEVKMDEVKMDEKVVGEDMTMLGRSSKSPEKVSPNISLSKQLMSPNKSLEKELLSPVKKVDKDTSSCSSNLKPKSVIESPKHKSPILSRSLDDWVIVKKIGHADKVERNEIPNPDDGAVIKSKNDSLGEPISPSGDLVESSQEPLSSPAKAMTKSCSVNLSRMTDIFASESAEVAFIAYQGSVIKCNLSPSKKEDQKKTTNGATVAANLFPSPRSKTGRGARMLNLAQSNKEEGTPPLDIKSPQESPSHSIVKECSTPPMKKPRRIRPVQVGDVSPQYHSLEIGCVVSDGNVTLHEYSPSASPKSSLMKKRKAVQEPGEDSPSPSAKKSRRVSFADPIVSKHVEFCIPDSERKFKKRTVNRCLKMAGDGEMNQAIGFGETYVEEVVFEGAKEASFNDFEQTSSMVKIIALDSSSEEQLCIDTTKELLSRKTCETAPIRSMEDEENIQPNSAINSKLSVEETSLEKSSHECVKEVPSPVCLTDISKVAFKKCSSAVDDTGKIENKKAGRELPFERRGDEACPELRDCSDSIDEYLWEKLTSRHWRERCKAHLSHKSIETVGDLSRLTEMQMDNIPFKNKKWKTLVDALNDYKGRKDLKTTSEVIKESSKESDSSGDLRIFREMLTKLSPEEIAKEMNLCSSLEEVAEHLVQSSKTAPKDFVSVATECKMSPKDVLLSAMEEDTLEETMKELSDMERMKLVKCVTSAATKSSLSSTQSIRDILNCALGEIRSGNSNFNSEEGFKWLFQNVFHPDEQMQCISTFLSNVDSELLSLFVLDDERIMKNVQKSISPLQAVKMAIFCLSESKSPLPLPELNELEDIIDKQRSSEDVVNRFCAKILQRIPKNCDKH